MTTDKDLAREHVEWYMGRLKEQLLAWCDITEQLLIDNFLHGIKHGRELEQRDRWHEREEIQIREESLPKDV